MKITVHELDAHIRALGYGDEIRIPLIAIAYSLTQCDPNYVVGSGSGRASGMFQVNEQLNGIAPPDIDGQIRQAAGILDMMKAEFLYRLELRGRGTMSENDPRIGFLEVLMPWLKLKDTTSPPPTVDGGKDRLVDFLAATILCWRWPSATQHAIDRLTPASYTYADLIANAGLTPAEAAWTGTVSRLIDDFPDVIWSKAALSTPTGVESSPVSSWTVLKWGAVVLLLVGLALVVWRVARRARG